MRVRYFFDARYWCARLHRATNAHSYKTQHRTPAPHHCIRKTPTQAQDTSRKTPTPSPQPQDTRTPRAQSVPRINAHSQYPHASRPAHIAPRHPIRKTPARIALPNVRSYKTRHRHRIITAARHQPHHCRRKTLTPLSSNPATNRYIF